MVNALLVDDEELVLRMLSQVLSMNEFSVLTASSAAQATAILAQGQTFDVVITDLRMESRLAGFDVVRAAKQVVPRPLIVVLTAFPVPASDWREAGADALLVKGQDAMSLPKQLRSLLKEHTAERTLE
jgi:CheY-like chemotaxis protein